MEFLTTSLADPLTATVMLPVMELISNTSSVPGGRSSPYNTVSVCGPLARTTTTSAPGSKHNYLSDVKHRVNLVDFFDAL